MELSNIKILLNNYFEGNTSLEEEQLLRDYFAKNIVDDELAQYSPIFGYYNIAQKEVFTPKIFIPKKTKLPYIAIAASVILLASISVFWSNTTPKTKMPKVIAGVDYGSSNDPKIALQQTQKALALLSTHINKGVKSVSYVNQYNQTKKLLFKN